MDSYKVVCRAPSGNEIVFTISAKNEEEAKLKCAQHPGLQNWEIVNTELSNADGGVTVGQWTQNTRQQNERDALTAITRILDALGPNSYIAAAFDGCIEAAQANIELEQYVSPRKMFSQEAAAKVAEKDLIIEQLVAKDKMLFERLDQVTKECFQVKQKLTIAADKAEKASGAQMSFLADIHAQEYKSRAETAEREVAQLKARLYDLISSEKKSA